jgi:hypothetical protein
VVSFTPRSLCLRKKSPQYPLDRRLGGPRAGLDDVENRKFLTLQGLELRPLGLPARSQSLYRLHRNKNNPGNIYFIWENAILSHTDFIWNVIPSYQDTEVICSFETLVPITRLPGVITANLKFFHLLSPYSPITRLDLFWYWNCTFLAYFLQVGLSNIRASLCACDSPAINLWLLESVFMKLDTYIMSS